MQSKEFIDIIIPSFSSRSKNRTRHYTTFQMFYIMSPVTARDCDWFSRDTWCNRAFFTQIFARMRENQREKETCRAYPDEVSRAVTAWVYLRIWILIGHIAEDKLSTTQNAALGIATGTIKMAPVHYLHQATDIPRLPDVLFQNNI